MSFLNIKKLFILNLLGISIFCLCSESTMYRGPSKDKSLQIAKSSQSVYKEKVKELANFNIKNISFYLEGRKKEYKRNLKPSSFNKFKSAIVFHSKPLTYDKKMEDVTVESRACGDIVFRSEEKEIIIDICGKMFFWEGKRKAKYAFVSEKLTKLIIDEIKKIKDQQDVAWIANVLQENIKSNKKIDPKDKNYIYLNIEKQKKCINSMNKDEILSKINFLIKLHPKRSLTRMEFFFIEAITIKSVEIDNTNMLEYILRNIPPEYIGYVYLEDFLASEKRGMYFDKLFNCYFASKKKFAKKSLFSSLKRAFPNISGKDEDSFVKAACRWYIKKRDKLRLNKEYFKTGAEEEPTYNGLFILKTIHGRRSEYK